MKETSYGKRVRRRLESELTAERAAKEQAEARLAEAIEFLKDIQKTFAFISLKYDARLAHLRVLELEKFLSSTTPPPILAELNAVRAENQRLCDEISIITAPDDTGKVLLTKEQWQELLRIPKLVFDLFQRVESEQPVIWDVLTKQYGITVSRIKTAMSADAKGTTRASGQS